MSVQKDPGFGRGLFYGFGAYLIWGSFPLIITVLHFASPWEIIGWRIIFGFLLAILILAIGKSWRQSLEVLRTPRLLIWQLFATFLIMINWVVYVLGVSSHQTLEASLGYFINPLVTILLAVIFLGEKLSRAQWVATGFGLVAVIVLTFDYGRPPWIALSLAISFGLYGLAKNKLGGTVSAVNSYVLESGFLAPIAIAILVIVQVTVGIQFGQVGFAGSAGLALFGFLTAIPLILFGSAAKYLPLRVVGFLQYLTPIIQFLLAVFVLQEPMPAARLIGFTLVWAGLAVLIADAIWAGRQQKTK